MKLYHFTSIIHYDEMQKIGQMKPTGDVPITPGGGFRATWLTTDLNPKHQLWAKGSMLDKIQIRIEVNLKPDTEGLAYWPSLIPLFYMNESWVKALAEAGGNPKSWYIYVNYIALKDCKVHLFE